MADVPLYPIQAAFARGELSPRLYSRADIEHWKLALAECLNWVVLKQGGLRRRSGTQFIHEVKTSSKKVRLVPFIFSTVQAYIIELGDQYARFYANGGIVTSGGSPIELATPWLEADLFDLQFAQSADILYVAHPSYPPRQITRTNATTFNLASYDPLDGPYLSENATTTTMDPDDVTGNVTIVASSTTGVNDGAGFKASDVGRPISLLYSSKWYWAKITAFTDTTHVDADVKGLIEADGSVVTDFPSHAAVAAWRLGAWSDYVGWPGCVSFYQQRLAWARTSTQPQTIWCSVAGELRNFADTEPAQDDDAITVTILGGEVNAIQWLAESAELLIGTTGTVRSIGPSDTSRPFSAANLKQSRQTTFGAKRMQPVQIGNVAIYSSYFGYSLRELVYNLQQSAYISPELTILSEHAFRSGVVQMAYAQDPESIVWMAMGNGELVGVTYERDQQIVAIHRHRLGGSFNTSIINPYDGETLNPVPYGFVESVAVIPGTSQSELWICVKRTINGTTKRYVERLNKLFESPIVKADAVFADASATYSGGAVSAISGVTWLEGQVVSVFADGAVHPDRTVASGAFALHSAKSKVTYGLKYLSRAKTLGIGMSQRDGSGLGRSMTVNVGKIDVMETGYLELQSPNAREPELVSFRGPGDPMDSSPPLRSGFYDVRFDRTWKDLGVVIMQTDRPMPATVRSITPVFVGEP